VAPSPAAPVGRFRLEWVFVLLGVAIAALSPFLPLLLRERGLQPDAIGIVLAVVAASGLITTGLLGHLGDARLGRVPMLRWTSVAAAVTVTGFLFGAERFLLLLVLAALFGAASQSVHPLLDAVALDELERRGRGDYGRVRLWASASFAAAVLGFGFLFERTSLELLIPAFALASLACLIPLAGLNRAVLPVEHERPAFLQTVAQVATVAPRVPLFLASVLLINTAVAGTLHFLPLRMDDVGSSLVLIGLGAAVAAVLEIPVMLSTGRLARIAGPSAVYLLGCLIYLACFLAFLATDDPTLISVVWGVSGAAYALLHVGSVIVIAALVPPTSRGLGQGLLQTVAAGVAPIAGAWAGGALFAALGSGALFTVATALATTATVVAWFALRPTAAWSPATSDLSEPRGDAA